MQGKTPIKKAGLPACRSRFSPTVSWPSAADRWAVRVSFSNLDSSQRYPVGMLQLVEFCHLDKARLLKIGGIPAAPCVAEGLQIAANDGAVHAELFGDLLLGESGEVQLERPPSPFGQRLASQSFLGMVVLPFG